jgi:large subunit ribosomal protein L3
MAGHMGVVTRTVQNLLIHRIDSSLNCLFVRGSVPGSDDAFVSVKDSKKLVGYRAQSSFRKGVPEGEWLSRGVKELPTPAGTRDRAAQEGWPEVVEWSGKQ